MTTKEIAEILEAELVGDDAVSITGIASLEAAKVGDLSFAEKEPLPKTGAAAIVVSRSFASVVAIPLLKVDNPKLAFTRIARRILVPAPLQGWHDSIHVSSTADVKAKFIGPNVSIGDDCRIDEDVQIHAGVRIGDGVEIGRSTIVYPNCVIYDGAKIGKDCVIHAGSIIGSDGFGYVKDESGEYIQFPQVGSVVVGDNVEIGANSTIDRGSLGVTEIGSGTKIDNLVQIAHNVKIGKRVVIAAQTGIAGSSVIEDDVLIAGQVGIADHVTIKSGAIMGAQAGVYSNKILPAGFWMGTPAEPGREHLKRIAEARRQAKKR